MRKFWLENSIGERRPLNNENGIFLSNPTGLGATLTPTSINMRHGFFSRVAIDEEPQNSISGDLVFARDCCSYADYRGFADWVFAATKLYFIYNPYGEKEFYRRVEVDYLTKTEMARGEWLSVPFNLLCFTPWYSPENVILSVSSGGEDSFKYDFSYTPNLAYSASYGGDVSASMTSTGHIPAALKVIYRGAIINPIISVQNANGVLIGKCKITAQLDHTETLLFSSAYLDSYVVKRKADGTYEDLISKVDLLGDPFFKIPPNEEFALIIEASDSIQASKVEARVFYYYRTV